jgi:two-component system response regulator NreC
MTDPVIRIVLVDDHQMLRDGLRLLLNSELNLRVVGEAANGSDGLSVIKATRPDLIILDLGLPDMGGLAVIEHIQALDFSVRIIVLSMHTNPQLVSQAMKSGAEGYIPKSSAHTSLLDAVQVVMRGEHYLHPKAATALLTATHDESRYQQQLASLSEREIEVVRMVALGYTSREIGETLFLSPKTVDTYRQRAMEKLEFERRADLVRFAIQTGLLDAKRQDDLDPDM